MKKISPTKKLFTVVFQYCDPPQPILIYNTNSESKAYKYFRKMKKKEIKNNGGGEFSITLYKHRHDPSFRYIHRTNGHIYGLEYNSEVIDEFNYMNKKETK